MEFFQSALISIVVSYFFYPLNAILSHPSQWMLYIFIEEEKTEGPHNNDRNIKPAPEEHSMSRGTEAEGQAIP